MAGVTVTFGLVHEKPGTFERPQADGAVVVTVSAAGLVGDDNGLAQETMATGRMIAMITVLGPGMMPASNLMSDDVLCY